MSLFGQVWLWSLAAFVVGALLTGLVLVLPARRRVRELENRLLGAHADAAKQGPAAVPTSVLSPVPPLSTASGFTDFASSTPPSGYAPTVTFEPAREPEFGTPPNIEPLAGERAGRLEGFAFEAPDVPAVPESSGIAADGEDRLQAQYHEFAREPEPESEPEPEHVEPRHFEPDLAQRFEPEPEPEHVEPHHFEPDLTQRFEPAPLEPDPASGPEQPEPEPEPEPEARTSTPDWFDGDESPPEGALFEDTPDDSLGPNYARENLEPETPRFASVDSADSVDSVDSEAPEASETPEMPGDGETLVEEKPALPKRRPRQTPRGGFDPPVPIQPSMRAIERREPSSDLTGGYSGSLFEPAVQPGGHAMSAPEPPPAREVSPYDSDVPPGPFGPGSAMPRPGGGCPADDFTVKASVTALRYCAEDSPQFSRMVAEVWFRTAADAERVGFRPLG